MISLKEQREKIREKKRKRLKKKLERLKEGEKLKGGKGIDYRGRPSKKTTWIW